MNKVKIKTQTSHMLLSPYKDYLVKNRQRSYIFWMSLYELLNDINLPSGTCNFQFTKYITQIWNNIKHLIDTILRMVKIYL